MHKQLKNQKIPSFYWDIQYSVLSLPCVVTYGFFTFFTYFSCFSTLFEHVFNAYGTNPWQFFALSNRIFARTILTKYWYHRLLVYRICFQQHSSSRNFSLFEDFLIHLQLKACIIHHWVGARNTVRLFFYHFVIFVI